MGHPVIRTVLHGLVTLVTMVGAQAALAQVAPAASHAARTGLAPVVAGILGYTRWPTESPALRLCTLGRGPAIDELLSATDLGTPQRRVAVQALAAPGQARTHCDAVYVADGDAALVREAVRTLAGQPVLLLGEGADFCSDGGMFCFEPEGAAVRFGANLDAIARGGLRVNPLVLRIARGARS